jgi:hypothetical protein
VRPFVFAFLVVFSGATLAQPPSEKLPDVIRSMARAGAEPIVAEATHASTQQKTVAAIVQVTTDTAIIVVASEGRDNKFAVVARSKPLALSRESNFGAWLEEFRLLSKDRLMLVIASRNGCARKVITHRFALRDGIWLVSGLDSAVMRCADNGVEQDFSETANYLSGKAIRTVFSGAKTSRNIRLTNPRNAFPLSEFPPNGPEAAYAELQQ